MSSSVKGDIFHRKGTTKPIQLVLYSNREVIDLTNVSKVEIKLKNKTNQQETAFDSINHPDVIAIASPPTSGIIEITPIDDPVFTTDGTYDYYIELTDSGGINSIPQNTQYLFKTDDWF